MESNERSLYSIRIRSEITMRLAYAIVTDRGKVREINEDSALISKVEITHETERLHGESLSQVLCKLGLVKPNDISFCAPYSFSFYIGTVADGVGGLEKGEVASYQATRNFNSILTSKIMTSLLLKRKELSEDHIFNTIKESLDKVNEQVLTTVVKGGTTITSALVLTEFGSKLSPCYIASVGDSRGYLISPGENIYQITRDQSLAWKDFEQYVVPRMYSYLLEQLSKSKSGSEKEVVQEWWRKFLMQKFEFLKNHSSAHVIWNVIGYYGEIGPPSLHKLYLTEGDIILLCSDGLTDELDDLTIFDTVTREFDLKEYLKDPYYVLNKIANSLVNEALKRGGRDNITVVLLSGYPDNP